MTPGFRPLTRRAAISGAAGAALALLGAGPARSAGGRRIALEVSHALQGWPDLRTRLAEACTAAHPDLSIDWLPGTDDWDVVAQESLRAGLVGQLPDLSHQSLNNLRTLVDRGLVVSLDPFLATAGGWESLGYLPALKETVTLNGRIYALPFATTVPVLYCNMDLAERAGFAGDSPPDDWPDVLALARRINGLGDGVMGIHAEYTASSAWIFQALVMSQGGRLMNPAERRIMFDGPEGLRALDLLQQFGEAGHTEMTTAQARQAFNGGKIGILIRSASGIAAVEQVAKGRFRLRIGRFPIPGPNGRLPGAGNGIVMFATEPARQRAAWDYMSFATGPAGATILAETTGYAPVNLKALSQAEYLAGFYATHPNQKLVIDSFPILTDWYAFPGGNSVRIFKMLIDRQRDVITRRMSPKEALALMADDTRKLLP